jgi:transcriptional regulator of aromatic amino acid metabolism
MDRVPPSQAFFDDQQVPANRKELELFSFLSAVESDCLAYDVSGKVNMKFPDPSLEVVLFELFLLSSMDISMSFFLLI